jgi:RNA polymerase sigma-70 factor (ECF subfamily)
VPEEDGSVVEAVIGGRIDEYGVLVDRYHYLAEQWAFGHLRSWADVEVVVQDSFVEAYRRLPSLREPARFASWFRSIVTNQAVTKVRQRDRTISLDWLLESFGEGEVHSRSQLSATPTVLDELQGREREEALIAALERLSPEHRRVVGLFYYKGRSYQEIADDLTTTLPAVRSMLHRARCQLKKEVNRRG